MTDRLPIHLIIPTHTTERLEICLVGIARQSTPPATLTVTCDVDDPAIGALLRECADRYRLAIRYVRREHGGTERLAQVRNNAVRALLADGFDSGRLLFLDGDTYAPPATVALHAEQNARFDMLLPGRINLDEERTAKLDPAAIYEGRQTVEPSSEDLAALYRAHRRAEAHQRLRRFHLTKSHKPKLLGGHHSVSFAAYLRVNGHDEAYHTWGTEDDDFARRVYQSGGRSRVMIRQIPVFHLYHPTRGGGNWSDRENARRFARTDLPVLCENGVRNPWPQPPVLVDRIAAAGGRPVAGSARAV